MQSLLEKVNGRQAPSPSQQGEAIPLPPQLGAGQLLRYLVQEGQRVVQGKIIAKVEDAEGLPWDITAPRAGLVTSLPLQPGPFEAGATLAYLVSDAPAAPKPRQDAAHANGQHPASAAPKPPQRGTGEVLEASAPPRAERGQTGDGNGASEGTNGHGTAAESSSPRDVHQMCTGSIPESAVEEPPTPARRSTLPDIEALVEVEELRLAPAPNAAPATNGKSKTKRERTRHHTIHLTHTQIGKVKKLALRLALDDILPGCSESELYRTAVELLLGLPEPALFSFLKENREREKAGKYGAGWPRPGGVLKGK